MIGIITAMKQEANLIIEKYNLQLSKTFYEIKVYKNEKIVLILSGIGKIQSAIGTSVLIQNFNPNLIINIGIAGNTNLNTQAKVGDVFLIEKVIQHDIYLPFEGEHLNYIKNYIKLETPNIKAENFNIFKGICATGDQFIEDEEKIKLIKEKYKADVVEMEAFSVASTAREFGLLNKTYIIKAISDDANQDAKTDHIKNLELAMKNSINVLDKILQTT